MSETAQGQPFVKLVLVAPEALEAFALHASEVAKEESPVMFVGEERPPEPLIPSADYSPFG